LQSIQADSYNRAVPLAGHATLTAVARPVRFDSTGKAAVIRQLVSRYRTAPPFIQNTLLAIAATIVAFLLMETVLWAREVFILQIKFRDVDASVMHIDLDDPDRWERFEWDERGNNVVHIRSENPVLLYELRPNSYIGTGMRTNEHGFRDDSFEKEKPVGTFRIAVLGDSITYGWNLIHEELYTEVLEEKLNALYDQRFEVCNFAINGYNAEQEAELLRTRVLDFDPDLVLIGYCGNDHIVGADGGLWVHFSRGWSRTTDQIQLLFRRIQDLFVAEKNIFTLSYEDMVASTRGADVPLAIVAFPHLGAKLKVQETIDYVRNGLQLPLLDLRPYIYKTDLDDTHFFDDVHPNAVGHRIAAERILDFLAEEALIPEAGVDNAAAVSQPEAAT